MFGRIESDPAGHQPCLVGLGRDELEFGPGQLEHFTGAGHRAPGDPADHEIVESPSGREAARDMKTLFVRNIHPETRERDLRELLSLGAAKTSP